MLTFSTRRHRRKLLFSPGLLALATLLWLGGGMISRHSSRLKQRVMLLSMPRFEGLPTPPYTYYESTWIQPLSSPAKISAFRSWREITFSGNNHIDSIQRQRLIAAARAISLDTQHDGGVRVRFTNGAYYKDLVFALDLVNRENIKKYWLDIKHGPAKLYIISYVQEKTAVVGDCEGMTLPFVTTEQYQPISLQTQLHDWVVELWQFKWLEPLMQPEWRASMFLLAAIALLSCWQITRNLLASRG